MTTRVQPCAPPASAYLDRFSDDPDTLVDCFGIDVPNEVSLAEFVEAFLTAPVFRLERLVLRIFAGQASSDAEAARLATGASDRFAMWKCMARDDRQLLTEVVKSPFRSWWMAEPLEIGTRLYFGSAVLPRETPKGRRQSPGVRMLSGGHRLYSRILLSTAAKRLRAPKAMPRSPQV